MKYIIDIEDEYTKDWVNETPMCKELCIPISVPNRQRTYHVITGFKLEPYTEPDRKVTEDEKWELAERIADMSHDDFISCFEGETEEYFYGLPYHEVKAKYDAWKKEKEGIHVGDEVEYIDGNTNAFVIYLDGAMCDLIYADGGVAEDICLNMLRPTGRKCPEVLKFLETLQREYDDQ